MRDYSEFTKQRIAEVLKQTPHRDEIRMRDDLRGAHPVNEGQKVIIIGAGISGLCCAYELEQLGFEVTILEAQSDHLGGRIKTMRRGKLHCEWGAMRIPVAHHLTRKYIEEFGLSTRPFVQQNKLASAFIRGMKVNRTETGYNSLKSKFDLLPEEEPLTADQLWEKSVISVLSLLRKSEALELYSDELSSSYLKDLDQKSLYGMLVEKRLSRSAIEFVTSVYGLPTFLNTAFLEHLREEKEGVWLGEFLKLEDGMDSLIKKFVSAIRGEIRQGAVVNEIINGPDRAEVVYIDKNKEKQHLSGDWVICTVPLGVLSKMKLSQCFSSSKIHAIKSVNYDSATKIISVVRNRFWECTEGIYGGSAIYDGGLGHTWYPSDNVCKSNDVSNQKSLLLSSYTWGMHARRIDGIPEDALNDYVYSELKNIHPYLRSGDILESTRWSWDNNPWSCGAYAFFNPGDHTDLHVRLTSPEHRVLLAGEHCSLTHSWIQGALESALKVCTQIIK